MAGTQPASDDTDIRTMIVSLQEAAATLRRLTPSDMGLADAVGDLRAVEVKLADIRRRWETLTAEMEPVDDNRNRRVDPYERAGTPVARGERYELVPQFKTVRTYNTPAILVAVASAIDGGPTDALMESIGAGAAKLSWSYTKLRRLLGDYGVTMTVAAGEVSDDDGTDTPMIGEYRKQAGVKRVPIREGDDQ